MGRAGVRIHAALPLFLMHTRAARQLIHASSACDGNLNRFELARLGRGLPTQQRSNLRPEQLGQAGLGQKAFTARRASIQRRGGNGRQDNDRNVSSRRTLLELGCGSPAIETRHGQIHHDYMGFFTLGELNAGEPIIGRVNLTAHDGQVMPVDEPGIQVIVYDEDDGVAT